MIRANGRRYLTATLSARADALLNTIRTTNDCIHVVYEKSDTHGALIDMLLMNGFNDFGGVDIPSSKVHGYSEKPRNSFDKPAIKVGADTIRGVLR